MKSSTLPQLPFLLMVKSLLDTGLPLIQIATAKARAFRWSRETGMQTLNHWLASNGVNATNIVFSTAIGVSADGNAVIGTLENVHGFLARVETGRSSYEPWMLLLSDE